MPIPLPPHHLLAKLEKELLGQTDERQIAILRRYLSEEIPSGWRGPYKVLRERLQRQIQRLETLSSSRSAAHQDAFHLPRQGDGRICVIGTVNSGKSAIVAMLTAAPAEVGDYPFTTQTPAPGMLEVEGAAIQVVDTPAFVPGLSEGEGPGRRLLHLVGSSDALAIVVDLSQEPSEQMNLLLTELDTARCRLLPNALTTDFRLKGKGGIRFAGRPIAKEEQAVAQGILAERHVTNGEVFIRERFSADELTLQSEGETLLPTVLIAHKNDVPEAFQHLRRLRDAHPQFDPVETNFLDETGVPQLKAALLNRLGLERVFLLDRPDPDSARETLYVANGSAVQDVAETAGMRMRPDSLTARIWGLSARYGGQVVGPAHLLEAEDAVYLKG